jgi:hypothetical protein
MKAVTVNHAGTANPSQPRNHRSGLFANAMTR